MGNRICLHDQHEGPDDCLKMSNGLTAVFIDVLVLAGSALAATEREKELIVWLAGHDQGISRLGTVGFDISDIPWTMAGFVTERAFLLRVIEAAQSGFGWDRLAYQPNEALLRPALAKFLDLINNFDPRYIAETRYQEWRGERAQDKGSLEFARCPKHDVLLYQHGCVLCNW